MTIYRTITPEGRFLYYMARLQRRSGVGYSYSQDIEEIKAIIEKHWEACDNKYVGNKSHRSFQVTDRILWGARARKWARDTGAHIVARGLEVNGCRIVSSEGRCRKADNCQHYFDCLDTASAKNWPGWREVGGTA